MSDLMRRGSLVLLAVAAYLIGFSPTWWIRDAVLGYFGSPAYEREWILIPHLFLYSTLSALFCLAAWLLLQRAKWIAPASFALNWSVVLWGVLGGVIAIGATVAYFFLTGQSEAFHAPTFDLWNMGANAFSNFFEEYIFRGFILAALAAALGFWPALLLSSLAFGFVHGQYPLSLQFLIAGMGAVWGLVGWRAKSLLAPYISHMTLDWVIDRVL